MQTILRAGLAYADSYTLAGCTTATHCGVFTRVPARCTPGSSARCPGEGYARGNTDPTLCDGAPVYQKGGAGTGPVLLRVYDGCSKCGGTESTRWFVTDNVDAALAQCHHNNGVYLQSGSTPKGLSSAPTAQVYSAGGWSGQTDAVGWSENGGGLGRIYVTAGGGR